MVISYHQPRDCLLNRLFKAQIKENIKAPRRWPLCGEFTGDRWIALTGLVTRKMFPFDDVIILSITLVSLPPLRLDEVTDTSSVHDYTKFSEIILQGPNYKQNQNDIASKRLSSVRNDYCPNHIGSNNSHSIKSNTLENVMGSVKFLTSVTCNQNWRIELKTDKTHTRNGISNKSLPSNFTIYTLMSAMENNKAKLFVTLGWIYFHVN